MSKPVKEMLRKEITDRLAGVDSLAVVGFTGVDAVTTSDEETRAKREREQRDYEREQRRCEQRQRQGRDC